ncbi:MAG TPA: hypothetical protein VIY66_11625 [Candidatus Acidoferrales bacterium]
MNAPRYGSTVMQRGKMFSTPRRYFIRKAVTLGQLKIRLFEFDSTPNGYHGVAYCPGLRQAKLLAEERP